ncbi:Malonyl-CoA-acyl carrier protein transacylase mitochondrial [Fasciola hepatica]|uniref:Malonyl-CoA-acyl carrier protein transacylase mitochondrial n=1 Tax=Fasciola hepatica TaxID=6192 RepID=A0A4E0QVV9_FASHE|nr:Malonyl-CoA-acyl carrier protein transacylase mitochondrial [Fasciola hepatica]
MKSATGPFSNALSRVGEIKAPKIPVLSAVDLIPYRNPENIKRKLVAQLVRPVLWEQTIQALYERPPGAPFPTTFEVGPGRQLGTIMRMVNRKAYDRYRLIDV